jgi:hypothetical protein
MVIQQKRLFNLDPSDVQKLPKNAPDGATNLTLTPATYTLYLDTSSSDFNFYYVTMGIVWPFSIYDNLNVALQLDSARNWEFIQDAASGVDPMTIGKPKQPGDDDEATRYWSPDITPKDYAGNHKLQQINFSAMKHLGVPQYNPDPFNLYIRLYNSDGTWLEIALDPDMQNPGDPPGQGIPPG